MSIKKDPFPPLELFEPHRTVRLGMVQLGKVKAEKRHPQVAKSSRSSQASQEFKEHGETMPIGAFDQVAPRTAAALFHNTWSFRRLASRFFLTRELVTRHDWSDEELAEAEKRGDFGRKPSRLFLQMYADILTCLAGRPLAGHVSPALIGTNGTVPLSVISTIPDIMKHYYDVIVRAQHEVVLVTNYWQPSNSVHAIRCSLIELSKRALERGGAPVVVKIMWDRGAIQQLWNNHVKVTEKTWVKLGLPYAKEIQGVDLEIVNFHRPLLGTFHQKLMVVDRQVALLNSNNIQDRPNIEMMVHLEGPVVDSLYDVFLLSWHTQFNTPLPLLAAAPFYPSPRSRRFKTFKYKFSYDNHWLGDAEMSRADWVAGKIMDGIVKEDMLSVDENGQAILKGWGEDLEDDEGDSGDEGPARNALWWKRRHGKEQHTYPPPRSDSLNVTDPAVRPETVRGSGIGNLGGLGFSNMVTQIVDRAKEEKERLSELALDARVGMGARLGDGFNGPSLVNASKVTLDSAAGSSTQVGRPDLTVEQAKSDHTDVSDGSEHSNSGSSKGLKTLSKDPLFEDTSDNTVKENKDEDSIAPGTATPSRLQLLSSALNAGALSKVDAGIVDEGLINDFSPTQVLKNHSGPVPMAIVNRGPHGMPGHQDLRVPQNAAWLSGMRYAEKEVFIQTPTLNASPIVNAVLEACKTGGADRQGVKVILWLDLGFNDKGESVPFQGGTNEEVVFRLYSDLRAHKKEHNLDVYWYTGKDQTKPINAVHKSRNCHVKFMAIDNQCVILGNGNQDTQSWFHSQECNVLIDDADITTAMIRQLKQNQSTQEYGKVDSDGIWRDPTTGEALQAPEHVSCFTAVWAMI